MKVGISRRHVFQNLWSKLAYFTAPQVTHAQTIYSLTYISEAEFSAVIIQLFAQRQESLYISPQASGKCNHSPSNRNPL